MLEAGLYRRGSSINISLLLKRNLFSAKKLEFMSFASVVFILRFRGDMLIMCDQAKIVNKTEQNAQDPKMPKHIFIRASENYLHVFRSSHAPRYLPCKFTITSCKELQGSECESKYLPKTTVTHL